MATLVGKTGFEQVENPAPVFGFGDALDAAIADGDFRTYVLLCQWAWQEHPEAEQPFTERTYEQMAALHPAHRRPTAETVRGRIYRLVQVGLVRRERAGRTTWRTYPVLETDGLLLLGGAQRHTQSRVPAPNPEGAGTVQINTRTERPASDRAGAPHPDSAGGQPVHTQGNGRAERRYPAASLAVGQARSQAPDRAHEAHPNRVGEQPPHTQTSSTELVRGQHEHTQEAQGAGGVSGAHPQPAAGGQPQHTQNAGRASAPHPDAGGGHEAHTQAATTQPLGGQPQHTQAGPAQGVSGEQPHTQKLAEIKAPTSGREALDGTSARRGWGAGTHPDGAPSRARVRERASCRRRTEAACVAPSRARVRERASVLTGTDPLSFSSSHTGREDQSVSTDRTDAHAAQHRVLSLVTVPQGYEGLAVTLATMEPQGMNYEGIEECLAQPELTQAWYDYVQRTEETIYNPAAYIRHGVRSGRKPPTPEAKKPQKQAHDPNDFGWDDPTIPAELYAKYQFANGPYLPPHLREKQGAQPTH